jgi:homoserine dehydrogenase
MKVRQYKLGLLGCGTVGRGLVDLVTRNRVLIRERSGVDLSFTRILVRDLSKPRPGVDQTLLTNQPDRVINNGCDMVVELVGGLEPARTFIRRALSNRKHVVTANKALLAADGFTLLKAAAARNVQFGFEASVCAGIPIVHALKSGLIGNNIHSITGILNGTCNYILTRMEEAGFAFEEALREAQSMGFAEADPALDIDGHDAAQKLKILSELAFDGKLPDDAVRVEGIRDITSHDIEAARRLGYVVKHVAVGELDGEAVSVRVHPVLLPESHQLAAVHHENNAVLVKGDAVGEMLFHGKGAGSLPSASAVLSDIVAIASRERAVSRVSQRSIDAADPDVECKRYLRFPVLETSAIGTVTSILERHGIVVNRATAGWAKNSAEAHQVTVVTMPCRATVLNAALKKIAASGVSEGKPVTLRMAA